MALKVCSLFGKQHVYTTAQKTYTDNILAHLDPHRTLFEKIIYREKAPESVKQGKDLLHLTDRLDRVILFDDRTKNFTPQAGKNGVHVLSYERIREKVGDKTANGNWRELQEISRLVGISVLALLVSDVRQVLYYFRSEEHEQRFPRKDSE